MAVLKSVMALLINGNTASVNAKSWLRSAIPGALVEVAMANDKGPNIKKKQKCKVHVISTVYQGVFPNPVLMAFQSVPNISSQLTC